MLALTRQLVVAHESSFLGAALGGLRLEDCSDQPITVSRINLLHLTDPPDFLGVITLMELARQDTLGATQLGSASLLRIVGVSEVRINELPGGRVSREAPTEGCTDAFIQSLQEVTRLGGL
ncbi:Uncharacterised protein [Mycobacteroides abscessus subsp. abscessus]|nr:Uncharacterised protein [Mycobacteroides abscessus subsp. abscessus]